MSHQPDPKPAWPRRVARVVVALVVLGAPLMALPAWAQSNATVTTDQPGATDSPLTGRYKGAALLLQTHKAFDELTLPSGPEVGEDYDAKRHFSKTVTAQGEVTRSIYVSPPGRSVLEVTRNYRDALTAKGFAPVFECAGVACGPAFRKVKYAWDSPATHVTGLNIDVRRQAFVKAVFDAGKDVRYALLSKGGTYVAVFGALNGGGGFGDTSTALNDRVSVLVEVVEPKAMDRNIVVLDAGTIGRSLAADGAVSLYGLYFDTDKATLQPASKPQLDQIAAYLKANPAVQVYVVGHTDGQGGLDHNMALADARAKAIAASLATTYGVAPGRMLAKGVGPLAPVATNHTEAGRAKNRRVQLVLR